MFFQLIRKFVTEWNFCTICTWCTYKKKHIIGTTVLYHASSGQISLAFGQVLTPAWWPHLIYARWPSTHGTLPPSSKLILVSADPLAVTWSDFGLTLESSCGESYVECSRRGDKREFNWRQGATQDNRRATHKLYLRYSLGCCHDLFPKLSPHSSELSLSHCMHFILIQPGSSGLPNQPWPYLTICPGSSSSHLGLVPEHLLEHTLLALGMQTPSGITWTSHCRA